MKKMRKGFTLIELTVVMGVMALLMALAVPNYLNYREEVKALEVQQDIKNITDEALKIMLSPSYVDGDVTMDEIAKRLGSNGLNLKSTTDATPLHWYTVEIADADVEAVPADPGPEVIGRKKGDLIVTKLDAATVE